MFASPPTSDMTIASSPVGPTSKRSNLTIDDQATQALPDEEPLTSGSFRPADYGTWDIWPAPAPTPSGNVDLAAFNGTNPNGEWKLYACSDTPRNIGLIWRWMPC